MSFFRNTVANVTTKIELESALISADKIIVKGDENLLNYARNVNITKQQVDTKNLANGSLNELGETVNVLSEHTSSLKSSGTLNKRKRLMTWSVIFTTVIIFLSTGAHLIIEEIRNGMGNYFPSFSPGAGDNDNKDFIISIIQLIVWPVVAIVAIFALIVLVKIALSKQNDVDIRWKVTDNFIGQVTITRIKG